MKKNLILYIVVAIVATLCFIFQDLFSKELCCIVFYILGAITCYFSIKTVDKIFEKKEK